MFVYVYRNLKHGRNAPRLYSILRKGRVIARRSAVLITQASFIVREAGRQKVLRTGRKNVHAFVKGYLAEDARGMADLPTRVHYDPTIAGYFYVEPTSPGVRIGSRIDHARAVLLNNNGITCTRY